MDTLRAAVAWDMLVNLVILQQVFAPADTAPASLLLLSILLDHFGGLGELV